MSDPETTASTFRFPGWQRAYDNARARKMPHREAVAFADEQITKRPLAPTTSVTHERKALLILRGMMRQHMLDEFGVVSRTGCFDIVCRGIDGEPLPESCWAETGL